MADLEIRDFDRTTDLSGVLQLVGRSLDREETGAIFHPGGLQWWLRRLGRPGFHVGVMTDDGAVVGIALLDRSDVIVQSNEDHASGRTALVDWVESRRAGAEIFVTVAEDDADLRGALESRGYEPTERYGYELVRDLATATDPPDLPAGFVMTSLIPDLNERYIALHRAAWARPNAPSEYDRRFHDRVVAMPDFRYDLVPIAVAPDGELAAYCMSWWDGQSRSVEIEPLGTHPRHRRLGLARAIVREVFRRSRALGARYVLVWGSSSLPKAMALYVSAGMHARRVLRDYRLASVL